MIEPAAQQRKDHISRWFREIWIEGNEEIIAQLLPDEGVIHGLTADPLVGPGDFKEFVRSGHKSHRDVSVSVGEIRAATLQATAHLTVTATHRRTGKSVTYQGAFLVNFSASGNIDEAWFTADTASARSGAPQGTP